MCLCVSLHGRPSEGLKPLCDPAAGIFGTEGGGKAQGGAAAVGVLVSASSSLYPVALILTSIDAYHHYLLLLPPAIHRQLASLNQVFLFDVYDW